MIFILSKLFWIVIQPLSFAFICIALSFLLVLFGRAGPGLVFSGLGLAVLFIALFTNTGAVMMAGLENRYPRPDLTTPPTCAIVLGGGINTSASARRDTYIFTRAADRYVEALRLARLYPDMRILITGGDSALSGNINGEAEPAAKFFIDQGVDESRLVLEEKARNTIENARLTAEVLRQENIEGPCLLITSAYHMPRAVPLFEGQNVEVIAWPADIRTDGSVHFKVIFDRPVINATMVSTAMREWLGTLFNRFR